MSLHDNVSYVVLCPSRQCVVRCVVSCHVATIPTLRDVTLRDVARLHGSVRPPSVSRAKACRGYTAMSNTWVRWELMLVIFFWIIQAMSHNATNENQYDSVRIRIRSQCTV